MNEDKKDPKVSSDGIKRDLMSVIDYALKIIMAERQGEVIPERERKLAGDVLYMAGQVKFYQEMQKKVLGVLMAASAVNERPDTPNLYRLKKAIQNLPGKEIYGQNQIQA